ncbi:tripartite motif-containing protein 72-like isoform X1 [Stylophora pistillata]|nr:tripartite motif-containing protein 72-like isoform X1 [Stylophora pistillata]
MGGYEIGEKNRIEIDKDPHLCRLICAFCAFLSKEPTVSKCGHVFCRTCLIEISCATGSSEAAACPVDGRYLNLEECKQDIDAAEKIDAHVISCLVNRCDWRGRVSCLEDHLKQYHEGRQVDYAMACGSKDGEPSQEQQNTAKKIMEIEKVQRSQVVMVTELKEQLSAFADAVAKTQGFGQLVNDVRALTIKIQEQQEILTGYAFDELSQQLNVLQHKVQAFEEQLRVQKDQYGKCHIECLAESARDHEDRNMEVEILQGSINRLEKELGYWKNRYADLEKRHVDLQSSHNALQAQVTLS